MFTFERNYIYQNGRTIAQIWSGTHTGSRAGFKLTTESFHRFIDIWEEDHDKRLEAAKTACVDHLKEINLEFYLWSQTNEL